MTPRPPPPGDRRPNILLIGCESMDGRVLGHLAYPGARTPNLDRLAAEGVSFSAAYCNSPICNPSRSSMWTGRHPHAIRCWNNYTGLTHDAITFASLLAEAGYRIGDLGRRDKTFGSHSLRCRLTTWGRRACLRLPENGPHDHRVLDDHYANPWDRNNFDGDTPYNAEMNLDDFGRIALWIDCGSPVRTIAGTAGILTEPSLPHRLWP